MQENEKVREHAAGVAVAIAYLGETHAVLADAVLGGAKQRVVDETLEFALAQAAAASRLLELLVDAAGDNQIELCRRLHVFGSAFTVQLDQERSFICDPTELGWSIAVGADPIRRVWHPAILARRGFMLAAPAWAIRADELETELLRQADAKLGEHLLMVGFGGKCVNHHCDRFEYVGQGDLCERCGQRTTCADGVVDFGRARKALDI